MMNIQQIAKLITEDPDILNEWRDPKTETEPEVGVSRSPRLDPEAKAIKPGGKSPHDVIKMINDFVGMLGMAEESIENLDMDRARQLLEQVKPWLDTMIRDLGNLDMEGWSGPTGHGNPWAK